MAIEYGPKGLQVIGVTRRLGTVVPKTGQSIKTESLEAELTELATYHRDFALSWPLIVGETDANNVNYGEMGVPMTVIIDKKGIIRQIDQGYRPEKDIPFIRQLLAER